MKPDFDFEPDRQKEEEKKLNSIVGKLTETEKEQVYHDGKRCLVYKIYPHEVLKFNVLF